MTTHERFQAMSRSLDYDPETGVFRWRLVPIQNRHLKPGDIAGTVDSRGGYQVIGFGRRQIKAHRLAFFIANGRMPIGIVDHINGNVLDNRAVNLRECLPQQNAENAKMASNNTSGFPGVTWYKKNECWTASIRVNRKGIHLGFFDRAEDAYAAYREAKKTLHPFAPDGCNLPPVPPGADPSRRRLKPKQRAMLKGADRKVPA